MGLVKGGAVGVEQLTRGEVLDDDGGGGVEDDVSPVVEVVKVVPAVKAPVAEHMLQHQLLHTHTHTHTHTRAKPG